MLDLNSLQTIGTNKNEVEIAVLSIGDRDLVTSLEEVHCDHELRQIAFRLEIER